MTSQTPYATHPEVMISRAKFHARKPNSFQGVKTHTETELRFVA